MDLQRARHTAEMLATRMVAAGNGEVLRLIFYGSRARGGPRSSESGWGFVVVLNRVITDVGAGERRFERAAPGGSIEDTPLEVWPIEQEEGGTPGELQGPPPAPA